MVKEKSRRLAIRTRKIVSGDGEVTTARTVLCPTHGEAVALAVCGACERCESIDGVAVRCRPEMAQPTMRWSPMLRRMLPSAADRVAIADVMSRNVTCVRRDVSVESLTGLLLDADIGAVPVVDRNGYPVGLVSKTDLVRERWQNGDDETVTTSDEQLNGMHIEPIARATVGDVMVPVAFTLREDDPLSRAAAVMAVERVHHLPIVSAEGRVVGMLTSLDFVRWVAAQSGFADQA